MEGNLKDYINTQSFLYFDVDKYRRQVMDLMFSRIHAEVIKVEDFRIRFGLENSFFEIFMFLFDGDNFGSIVEYGQECFDKSLVTSMSSKI